jgi:hypothetical protein
MSDQYPPEETEGHELQFDQAEYDAAQPPALSCAVCKQPIDLEYFEINGQTVCSNCRNAIDASRRGGSKIARFVRAAVFGSAAGVAGFLLYFSVLKFLHMQIGLISIVVGFMVGKAVWRGSEARGGWFYQALAIFITYTAIGASYTATAFSELQEKPNVADKNAGAGGPRRSLSQERRRRTPLVARTGRESSENFLSQFA